MEKKNKMIFVAPYSSNVFKAIMNFEVTKKIECYLIGNENQIIEEAKKQHFQTSVLQIKHCFNEKQMKDILQEVKDKYKIQVMIFDCVSQAFQNQWIQEESEIYILFHPKQQKLYFVSYMNKQMENPKKSILQETKIMMEELQIDPIHIGLISKEKTTSLELEKKIVQKALKLKKVDIIRVDEIFQSKANFLIFHNQETCSLFLDLISIYYPIEYIHIKKASNEYFLDAYGMEFKELFFALNLLNKILANQFKINSEVG